MPSFDPTQPPSAEGIRPRVMEEALSALRQRVAEVPNDPARWTDLGIALGISGDPAAALAALNEALDRDPDFADARASRRRIRSQLTAQWPVSLAS